MYESYYHLIRNRGLNGSIELKDIKLTQEQLDKLRKYLKSEEILRICFDKVDTYKLIIVNSIDESDLRII